VQQVFSSTAAPKNIVISFKLWDSQHLQTITFHIFLILGSEAEILMRFPKYILKIPENVFVFWQCQPKSRHLLFCFALFALLRHTHQL
jgi:hypothetical protein